MVDYLWNWYPDIDENHQVFVSGIRGGAIRTEPVGKLLGIVEKGLLVENMQGQRIALEYAGVLDTQLSAWTAEKFPEHRRKQSMEGQFKIKLEADYCEGRLHMDSPLLFYLICMMAWEPHRWGKCMEDLWLMHHNYFYAVRELRRTQNELHLKESKKLAELERTLREGEKLLELGSGEAFYMRKVFGKDASGKVTDETKSVSISGGSKMAMVYFPHLYFCYVCSPEPCDLMDMAGGWHTKGRDMKMYLSVRNIGKEPLCIFRPNSDVGYMIPPGRQFAMDSKELESCESKTRKMLDHTRWLSQDFSLVEAKKKEEAACVAVE